MPRATYLYLVPALGCCMAEGKLDTGTFRIGGPQESDQWRYLSKFGYTAGSGTYEVRLRRPATSPSGGSASQQPQVDLELFLDEDWDQVERLTSCQRAPKSRTPESFQKLLLGTELGDWGPWSKGKVQSTRPSIWYFALSGCRDTQGLAQELEFEIRMRQFDRSELSAEMRCMPIVTGVALGWMTVCLPLFFKSCGASRAVAGRLHPIICALGAAVLLQWVALACEAMHLWSYGSNGVGALVMDHMSGVLDMLGQVATSSLLVSIAHGYSLTCSSVRDLPSFVPIVAAVAMVHVVLVTLDKLWGEDAYEHHENGGVLGVVMLAARFVLFVWFVVGLRRLQGHIGMQMQSFLRLFGLVGGAYLLAHPFLFVVVQAFKPYLRHPLLQIGLLVAQSFSSLGLCGLLLSGAGPFYQSSDISNPLAPVGSARDNSSKLMTAADGSGLRRRGCT